MIQSLIYLRFHTQSTLAGCILGTHSSRLRRPSFDAILVLWIFQGALNFEDPALQALIESLPEAPAAARRECLKMCGLLDNGSDALSYDFDYPSASRDDSASKDDSESKD